MSSRAYRTLIWLTKDEHGLPVIRLQVPGELTYRELATRTVSLVCKVATGEYAGSLSDDFTHELVSAVGEAFNNIVIHAYRGRDPGDVTLVIMHDGRQVRVELMDTGTSFDISAVKVPDLDALPERGMGLYIMRSFVDQMEYSAGSPNVLSMTKFLEPAQA